MKFTVDEKFQSSGWLRNKTLQQLQECLTAHAEWDANCFVIQIGGYPCIDGVVMDMAVSLSEAESNTGCRFDAIFRLKCMDEQSGLSDPKLMSIIPLQAGWTDGPFFTVDRTEDEMEVDLFWSELANWMAKLHEKRPVLMKVLSGLEAAGATLCSFHEDKYKLTENNVRFAVSFGDTTITCSLLTEDEKLAFGRDDARFQDDDYKSIDEAIGKIADEYGAQSAGTSARGSERLS